MVRRPSIMEEVRAAWIDWASSGKYPDNDWWLYWYKGVGKPHEEGLEVARTYVDFPEYDLGILDNPPGNLDECWLYGEVVLERFIEDLHARNIEGLFWHGLQGLLIRNMANNFLNPKDLVLPEIGMVEPVDGLGWEELLEMTEHGREILRRRDQPGLDATFGVAIGKFHELWIVISESG